MEEKTPDTTVSENKVLSWIRKLQFGQVLVKVENGKIVAIEATEKERVS